MNKMMMKIVSHQKFVAFLNHHQIKIFNQINKIIKINKVKFKYWNNKNQIMNIQICQLLQN